MSDQFETRFLRLMTVLAGHCPLGNRPKGPESLKKWGDAYSALFDLEADIRSARTPTVPLPLYEPSMAQSKRKATETRQGELTLNEVWGLVLIAGLECFVLGLLLGTRFLP